jgi:glutathione S-transferase
MKLTYFNIKGAGEPIRLACALNQVDFEDVRVSSEEWQKIKPSSKFGQLPMFELDDGTVMAQSCAILRYVGSCGNGKALPTDPLDRFKVDEALELCVEFGIAWGPCLYMFWTPEKYGFENGYGDTEEGKARRKAMREYFVGNTLKDYAAKFTKMIVDNGGFLAGATPSIADCHLVPRLEGLTAGYIDDVPPTCLDAYPELQAYISRFNSVPEVATYLNKDK